MSKAIVTGGLGFLGFEMCLAMLEEGFEVLAADTDSETGERWLEVGRNANISYQHLQQPVPAEFSNARFYINLYDHFTGNNPSQDLKEMKEFVEKNHKCVEKAFILLPSVISKRVREDEFTEVVDFLEEFKFPKQYTVYLPTLFGPHQPESFLFQQILSKSESGGSEYVDDIRSAIFVKDAVSAVINVEKESDSKKLQIVADNPDSWKESLHSLGSSNARQDPEVRDVLPPGLKKIVVKASSSVNEVLERQRDN